MRTTVTWDQRTYSNGRIALNNWSMRAYYKRNNFIIYEEHSHEEQHTKNILQSLRAFKPNTQRIQKALKVQESTQYLESYSYCTHLVLFVFKSLHLLRAFIVLKCLSQSFHRVNILSNPLIDRGCSKAWGLKNSIVTLQK